MTYKARGGTGRAASFALVLAAAALSGCAADSSSAERGLEVLYAGSMATVMENGLGPAFAAASGTAYHGEAHGSLGAGRLIRDHLRTPDVFISADPSVNETVLMGKENEDLVTWFVTFASSQLVLAYNPKSRFAADFEAASAGELPWYEVLERPGVRFGRGDPTIDPKGYRTLFLFTLAGEHYGRPEIPALLGQPLNPDQVLPEVALLARIESGQFDAGIFYEHEIVARKLPYVTFPPEINLSDPRFADRYAETGYTPAGGERVAGAPILFTVTIPETVENHPAAEDFVRFVLTADALLEDYGFGLVEHRAGGDRGRIPEGLRELCAEEAYAP